MKDIGKRFESILYDHRLTNKELAEKLDISEQSVRNYISGKRIPTAEILINIKRSFGISIDWLLTGETNENKVLDKNSTVINEPSSEYLKAEHIDLQREFIDSLKKNIARLESECDDLKKELSNVDDNSKSNYKYR